MLFVSPDEPPDFGSIAITRHDIVDDLIDASRPRHTLRPDVLIALPAYTISIVINTSKARGAGPYSETIPSLPQLADAYHRSVRSHKAAIDTQDIGVVANIALLCCRRRCEESRESEEK